MKHFISIADTSPEELNHVLDTALTLREERNRGQGNTPLLRGKTLAMVFEKKSLRTRVSFQQAMIELGGASINLAQDEIGLGVRESCADIARVLSGMVQGVCARVFEHAKLTELAQHSTIPIINALSDESHPCQALADAMTIIDEFGRRIAGRTLAFIGDGNNVARSLATICGKLGMNFVLASPPGYELGPVFVDRIMSQVPSMNFELTRDAAAAVQYADVVYTDTWVSMGQEQEKAHRIKTFAGYQVDAKLMDRAPKHAIVLHCLPAYRGLEISNDVMEGPRSRVFPQAHNRLHAQKGLLAVLLGGR